MKQPNPNDPIAIDGIQVYQLQQIVPQLQQQQIAYEVQRARDGQYTLTTKGAAVPIIDKVLATTARWDLFDRKPENRNKLSDALGFFIALVVLGTIIVQSEGVNAWATEVGFNPDIVRGMAIWIVGIVVTLFWSEVFLQDRRRHMFSSSMISLFLMAGLWFFLTGCGWDMAGELHRWLP
ncbi:MAG: hypothetical protein U0X20_07970 [Caldilineaceae bacterium]